MVTVTTVIIIIVVITILVIITIIIVNSATTTAGLLFIYLYPNESFIEALQSMFDPAEREEIFGK